MKLDDLVKRVEEIIAMGDNALKAQDGIAMGSPYTKQKLFTEYRAAGLSFLVRTFGEGATHPTEFSNRVANSTFSSLESGQGVLNAARGELAGGWIATTRGLVTAEVFADFLEMGEHLLDEHYKDAAAVVIGGTLEEHLRQLAVANGVPVEELKQNKMVPRKADAINAD